MSYEQKNLVHDAICCWTGNSDSSSVDDVLSGTLLSRIGPGILARGVGDLWDRSDCHFRSMSPTRVELVFCVCAALGAAVVIWAGFVA